MIMATYETFAAVYDAVMDDSLYDKWTDFSLRHLPKTKERKKLLELACGTGIQSVRFSQAGFDVTGLDLSGDMLKIAEKRATSAKQRLTLLKAICWIYPRQVNMILSRVTRTQSATCRMRWK
ncbi:Methyltransferase [Streptococcus mitis]|uniref:Methyltransferase n=1 Tax=Streptococcus mitis TaxID=28037 RepID=A0A150NWS7_STRMT|nr:Methyltransferase [Streptococcus mitis]